MRRASRSVTHNIAEGFGRFHHKENMQFCRISRGSLSELEDQIDVALDESYITKEQAEKFDHQINEVAKILNGYINYLGKK
jgi:four helix bundle protein